MYLRKKAPPLLILALMSSGEECRKLRLEIYDDVHIYWRDKREKGKDYIDVATVFADSLPRSV